MQFSTVSFLAAAGVSAAAVFFLPGMEGAYRLSRWGFIGILVFLLATSLILLRKSLRSHLPEERQLFLLALAFAGVAIIIPAMATSHMVLHLSGSVRLLIGIAFSIIFALLLSHSEPIVREKTLLILAMTGGVISLVVILQQLGVNIFAIKSFTTPEFRGHGTFGNPNWAAAFLVPLVPLSLGLMNSKEGTARKYLTALTILLSIGVVATLSKGGILALGIGVIVYLIMKPEVKSSIRWGVVAGMAIVAAAAIINAAQGGYLAAFSWTRGRMFLWQAALMFIGEHPLSGLGLGGFLPEYPAALVQLQKTNPEAFIPLGTIRFLHNDFLQAAVDSGVIALILFVALLAAALYTAQKRGDSLSRGVGSGVAAMAAYGLVDSPLHLPASALLFWFMIGWLMAGRLKDVDQAVKEGKTSPRIFLGVLLLVASISFVEGARYLIGTVLWHEGKKNLGFQERKHALTVLGRASRLLPEVGDLRRDFALALDMDERHADVLREAEAALNVQFDFDTLYMRLKALEMTGGLSVAELEWHKMIQDYPLLVRPHYELGRLYLGMKQTSRAKESFRRALSIKQESPGAKEYRFQSQALLDALEKVEQKHLSIQNEKIQK